MKLPGGRLRRPQSYPFKKFHSPIRILDLATDPATTRCSGVYPIPDLLTRPGLVPSRPSRPTCPLAGLGPCPADQGPGEHAFGPCPADQGLGERAFGPCPADQGLGERALGPCAADQGLGERGSGPCPATRDWVSARWDRAQPIRDRAQPTRDWVSARNGGHGARCRD